MRTTIFAAASAAVILACPAVAQTTGPTYTHAGTTYHLKALGSVAETEPKNGDLDAGIAVLVKQFKSGRTCAPGYVGIVIGAPSKTAARHRNCVANPA
jgi:hypothetical protein